MRNSLVWIEPASLFDVRQVARSGHLFAILDACDAPMVPSKVESLGEERGISLYRGSAEERFADIAPYLVVVDESMLTWIVETLWNEHWGILVVSNASLAELRTHFRKFLTVSSPTGESWYFRFYDPRVLEKYLQSCTEAELRSFVGPGGSFGVTDAATRGVRWLRRSTPQEAWKFEHDV